MSPRVLIADQLSPAAVAIFKERGLDTDVKVGLSKEELEKIIGDYDGLAVRSATKVTEKVIAAASQAEGGRPRRHRRRQHRRQGRDRQGHHRHEHALRQFHHHGRARALADDGAGPPDPGGRPLHAGRQVGEVEVPGRRALRQDAGRDRLRQHRLDRRRPRHRPEDEGDRLRSVPVAGARAWSWAWRRSSSTTCCGAPISSRCTRRSPTRPATSSMPAALKKTKKGVRIVNCARGGLRRRAGAGRALKSGQVAGAAFDVFEVEPAKDSPLFGLPNVICTPHLGAATVEAQENVALQVAEQMADYLLKGAITNAVNFPNITRRGGAAPAALGQARRAAGAVRRPAHRDQHQGRARSSIRARWRTLNTKPLTAAALAGVLRPLLIGRQHGVGRRQRARSAASGWRRRRAARRAPSRATSA